MVRSKRFSVWPWSHPQLRFVAGTSVPRPSPPAIHPPASPPAPSPTSSERGVRANPILVPPCGHRRHQRIGPHPRRPPSCSLCAFVASWLGPRPHQLKLGSCPLRHSAFRALRAFRGSGLLRSFAPYAPPREHDATGRQALKCPLQTRAPAPRPLRAPFVPVASWLDPPPPNVGSTFAIRLCVLVSSIPRPPREHDARPGTGPTTNPWTRFAFCASFVHFRVSSVVPGSFALRSLRSSA